MRVDKKKKLAEIQQIARDRGGGCRAAEYVNSRTKMPFVCAKGHEWDVRSDGIKNGRWCPQCYHEGRKVRAAAGLWEVIKERSGTLLSDYINDRTHVRIRCAEGHEWEVTPNAVKRGRWCPQCDHEKDRPRVAREIWEVVGGKGGTLLSDYINDRTHVRIRCAEGHEWEATPNRVKNGTWCPQCDYEKDRPRAARELREVIKERSGTLLSDYINDRTHVRIRCAEGHEWDARPSNVKNQGTWCPHCRNKSENAVRTMLRYVLELNFPPHSPKALGRLGIELRNAAGNLMHLDGFNIDICAAFEYHGRQHTDGGSHLYGHVPDSFKGRQEDDELKREQCKRAGVIIFEIYEELHGVWPHLNQLYSGLLDVLEENGVEVTGKPNLSDSAWMQLIASDREQTTLTSYLQPLIQEIEEIIRI